MRINEYQSLHEFISQYTGVWGPSEGHWLGLDFSFAGNEYRLQTGSMYEANDTILPDGRVAVFGLYIKQPDALKQKNAPEYKCLGEYANMDDLLRSNVIGKRPFKEIIMDDTTELLGQD